MIHHIRRPPARFLADPARQALSDWILYRADLNPYRADTHEAELYTAALAEAARMVDPDCPLHPRAAVLLRGCRPRPATPPDP